MVAIGKRPGSGLVIVGVSVVALTLGLLSFAAHHFGFRLPEWVYLGLLWLGTVGGALVNGYRDGGLVVSWFAAAIGVLPMTLALAPSGPPGIHPSLGDILVTATGGAFAVGLLAGSVSHAVGMAVERGYDALRNGDTGLGM